MNVLIIFYFVVIIAIGGWAGCYFSKPRSMKSFGYWLSLFLGTGAIMLAGFCGAEELMPFGLVALILSAGLTSLICWHVERKRHEQKLKKREMRKKQLPQPKSSRRFAQRR